MSCTADGFKRLTQIIIETKARADKCELRLAEATRDADAVIVELDACHGALAAIPSPPPKPTSTRPLTGYALGILGTISLAGTVAMDMPNGARFPVMLLGFGMLGAGAVLVLPQ